MKVQKLPPSLNKASTDSSEVSAQFSAGILNKSPSTKAVSKSCSSPVADQLQIDGKIQIVLAAFDQKRIAANLCVLSSDWRKFPNCSLHLFWREKNDSLNIIDEKRSLPIKKQFDVKF